MGLGKMCQIVVVVCMVVVSELLCVVLLECVGSLVLLCVLVFCFVFLWINWQCEINVVYLNDLVGMVGQDCMEMLYGCCWVVVNYEWLGGLVCEMDLYFQVMVVDEVYYLKEYMFGCMCNVFVLVCRIFWCFFVIGILLFSCEIELYMFLWLFGYCFGLLCFNDFCKCFMGSWECCVELVSELCGWLLWWCKDVFKDFGIKDCQVCYLFLVEGLVGYCEIFVDMILGVMFKIVKLCQILEVLKLQFIVEVIESCFVGDKFIVFCEYMGIVKVFKVVLVVFGVVCVIFVGLDVFVVCQCLIDVFQQDFDIMVFIIMIVVGGVGIILMVVNIVLFVLLFWMLVLMCQVEDWVYWLGQKCDVLVLVLLVDQIIDQQIWVLLVSKIVLEQDVVEVVCMQVDIKVIKVGCLCMVDMLVMMVMVE